MLRIRSSAKSSRGRHPRGPLASDPPAARTNLPGQRLARLPGSADIDLARNRTPAAQYRPPADRVPCPGAQGGCLADRPFYERGLLGQRALPAGDQPGVGVDDAV